MGKKFDPYHQWLGIRDASDQTPNHYRLLGLEIFEYDADVIQNAADQRMSHVRTYQTGPNSAISQKILNELSVAKICLLNAGKKAKYDAELKQQLAAEETVAAPAPAAVAVPVAPVPVAPAAPVARAAPARPAARKPARTANNTFDPLADDLPGEAEAVPVEDSLVMAVQQFAVEPGFGAPPGSFRRNAQPAWMMPAILGGGGILALAIAFVGFKMAGGSTETPVPPITTNTNNSTNTPPTVHPADVDPIPFPRPPQPPVNPNIPRPPDNFPPDVPDPRPPLPIPNTPNQPTMTADTRMLSSRSTHYAVGFSPEGDVAWGADDQGDIHRWTVETGRLDSTLEVGVRTRSAAFVPHRQWFVLAGIDNKIRIVNQIGQVQELKFDSNGVQFNRVVASADGNRVAAFGLHNDSEAGRRGGMIYVWELPSGRLVQELNVASPAVYGCISRDGQKLASYCGDSRLRIWDLGATASELTVSFAQGGFASPAIDFTPSGKHVVVGFLGGHLSVVDAESGNVLGAFSAHQCMSTCMLPDGKHLLTGGSQDNQVRLWSLQGGKLVHTIQGHSGNILALELSPDCKMLLTACGDRSVRIVNFEKAMQGKLDFEELLAVATPLNPTTPDNTPPDNIPPPVTPPDNTPPEKQPLVLGNPQSPFDLVATYVYNNGETLSAETDPVPKARPAPSAPAISNWPQSLQDMYNQAGGAAAFAPKPFVTPEAEQLFQTYLPKINAAIASKEPTDDLELARDFLTISKTFSNTNPVLSRYLLMRALGLAINAKSDPDLALELARAVDAATRNPSKEEELAVNVVRMNAVRELQTYLRRFSSHREQATELNDHLINTIAAVVENLLRDNQYSEVRPLISIMESPARLSKNTDLKEKPKKLTEQLIDGTRRQSELMRLLGLHEKSPDSPSACENLGQYYLWDLGNLELAAPLLEKSSNESYKTLVATYQNAKEDRKLLLPLAELLDAQVESLPKRPQTDMWKARLLTLAKDSLVQFNQVSGIPTTDRQKSDLLLTLINRQLESLPALQGGKTGGSQAAKDLDIPLKSNVSLKLKLIPAGKFVMGDPRSPQTQRQVEITKPFYIGVTEVTQGQWVSIMENNPSSTQTDANLPVDSLEWEDAQSFVNRLNTRFDGRYRFRLPTEAEWEYACRAGSRGVFSFGDNSELLANFAWYERNSLRQLHLVGQLKPNAWGLHDMHGNVYEWCNDFYSSLDPVNEVVKDPTGPEFGQAHVYRGGSYFSSDNSNTCATRRMGDFRGMMRRGYVGMRLVMEVP